MKYIPENIKVKIHNLGYCSEGIGKVIEGDKDGITTFIDNTTIGDLVEAETFKSKKGYLRAKLINIIEEGESRIKPKCPLAKVCGGCHWQHVNYEDQLKAKTNIVRDHICKKFKLTEDIVKPALSSPEIYNYRAKAQFPLGETKDSKRLLIGYYKQKSHEIVNIKYCPVQPDDFDRILNTIRDLQKNFKLKIYNENVDKGYLRHFILRKSFAENKILITFVVNSNSIDDNLRKLSNRLVEIYPQISGVTVNFNTENTNVILGKNSECILGEPYIIEKIGDKSYRISDKSFFQINPYSAKVMFDTIFNIIKEEGNTGQLLDIYAGGCAISIYLSSLFNKITAIESEKASFEDAKENFILNNIDNIYFMNSQAIKALEGIADINKFDWIVLDPPRSGCQKEVIEACSRLNHGKIIYVSCNPATLARDLEPFLEKGFKLKHIQPLDMFCHTYHVESVCLLVKDE